MNETTLKEDGASSLVVSRVSNLCEDLIEDDEAHVVADDLWKRPVPIVKEKRTRQRKVYDDSKVRRSTRKRTQKQYS
jgi:hypothetical protein